MLTQTVGLSLSAPHYCAIIGKEVLYKGGWMSAAVNINVNSVPSLPGRAARRLHNVICAGHHLWLLSSLHL